MERVSLSKALIFSAFLLLSLNISALTLEEAPLANGPLASDPLGNGDLANEALVIAQGLSNEELAGQVIMAGIDATGTLSAEEEKKLKDIKPGAIMLFKYNFSGGKAKTKALITKIGALNDKIAPFFATDNEGGAVLRYWGDAPKLPSPLSYWELSKEKGRDAALIELRRDAEAEAAEMREIGLNMNLAPVVEVLNEQNKDFLQDRSYGPDGAWVCSAALAFIQGMEKYGVACVIKHFPGNSGADPHKGPAYLNGTAEELDKETAPFYYIIREGKPAGVMVAHTIAKAWDNENNSTLSRVVIGEKLIKKANYSGIVLADDFLMKAVSTNVETTGIAALNAGCDMIMVWPLDLYKQRKSILNALNSGKLSRERLIVAASRIIEQKLRFGIGK